MSNQLITLPLPFGEAHVLPQHFSTYQTEVEKPRGKKAKAPVKYLTKKSAMSRNYPHHKSALKSTATYVQIYLAMNSLHLTGTDEYILNENPTTWPEGPDCIVTEDCEV